VNLCVKSQRAQVHLHQMQTFDANLLIALDALLESASVTRAAEKLGLSISAMSRTLTRIRQLLQDPILVQAGRDYVLTPRALEIRARVRAHAQEAQALVHATPPALADVERTFNIRTEETFITTFAAAIVSEVRSKSPRAVVRFTARIDDPIGALREGSIDLELGHLNLQGPEIRMQTLFTDRFVGVARADHPILSRRVTPLRYVEFPQVVVSRRGKQHGPIDDALEEEGLRRDVALVVPTFGAAIAAVSRTDMVTAVLYQHLPVGTEEMWAVRTFELPVSTPPLRISTAWHPRFHNDAVHLHLRESVANACKQQLATRGNKASSPQQSAKTRA
jgi:DNA-binding transcriptional LysR family regulator